MKIFVEKKLYAAQAMARFGVPNFVIDALSGKETDAVLVDGGWATVQFNADGKPSEWQLPPNSFTIVN